MVGAEGIEPPPLYKGHRVSNPEPYRSAISPWYSAEELNPDERVRTAPS